MKTLESLHWTLLASALAVAGIGPACAASVTIGSGTTATGEQSIGGADQLTIAAGGTLAVDGPQAIA